MQANVKQTIHSGRLRKDIHLPDTAKRQLVCFIASQLPLWRDDPERSHEISETKLTSQLCVYLNEAARFSGGWSHIQFSVEKFDESSGGRKIDLAPSPFGATLIIKKRRYTRYDTIFPIECKRLPTPKNSNRDSREYVFTQHGTTGGIQRFKFGHHGASHNFGAMIAYVQENSFSHWASMINGWIDELSRAEGPPWICADRLQIINHKEKGEGVCHLKSKHSRTKRLPDIELQHLWIQIN